MKTIIIAFATVLGIVIGAVAVTMGLGVFLSALVTR